MQIKTFHPDYRFTDFDQWIRYIISERYETENKNAMNAANDLIFKPLNIME